MTTSTRPPKGSPPPGSRRIGFVSTRFAGTDGVSLETAKWATVLERLGSTCFYFAGECDRPPDRSHVVPEAFYRHPDIAALNELAYPAETAAMAAPGGPVGQDGSPGSQSARPAAMTDRIHVLREHLKHELRAFVARFEIELLVIENASSIPLNLPLGLGSWSTACRMSWRPPSRRATPPSTTW
jgi:hypothetical protein